MAHFKDGKMWCWNVICRKNKSNMIPYNIGGKMLFVCDNCTMIQIDRKQIERTKEKYDEAIENARKKRREKRNDE